MAMHYRPTVAEINLGSLKFNVGQLQKKIGAGSQMMAVVKANAYGHGDVGIAKALELLKIPFLAVAYLEEGIRLRERGIKSRIVILTGGQEPNHFPELHHYKLTPVFYDLHYLTAYNDFCRNKHKINPVHLKFDTGMNRLGFPAYQVAQVFRKLPNLKNLKFEGMMTHFANAERPSHFNREQILLFNRWRKLSPVPFTYYHLANSGAILNDFQVNENLVRPGLTLYGAYPIKELRKKLDLRPVMTLKSSVIQLKKVKKGAYISYGYTHRFPHDSVVATVPAGYADGFLRYFSNKGEVLIRGKRAPVVGVVCMDVFMVDVGHIPGVTLQDEVVLLGESQGATLYVEELAERIATIPWEIFCHISERVPRMFVRK